MPVCGGNAMTTAVPAFMIRIRNQIRAAEEKARITGGPNHDDDTPLFETERAGHDVAA